MAKRQRRLSAAKWNAIPEIGIYSFVALLGAVFDLFITKLFVSSGAPAAIAKLIASALVLVLNFLGRRYLVFFCQKDQIGTDAGNKSIEESSPNGNCAVDVYSKIIALSAFQAQRSICKARGSLYLCNPNRCCI